MSNRTKTIIFFLFFASGVSGLIYEVVWIRIFGLVLGNTTYAISVIIGSFFAGLALGSFCAGRYIDRIFEKPANNDTNAKQLDDQPQNQNKLIYIYAYLEFGIAISALIVGIGTSGIENLLIWLNEHIHYSSGIFNVVRFTASFLLLFIPTTLMGATLPVLSKYIIKEFKGLRSGLGTLYCVNTFGAASGCLITGFFLIEKIGVNATVYTAVTINVTIGILSIVLERCGVFRNSAKSDINIKPEKQEKTDPAQKSLRSGTKATRQETPDSGNNNVTKRSTINIVLIAFAISGFTTIAYEITWTRMLSSIFLNSIYSFTTMLTTFLCGLAIGALIISRFFKKAKNPLMLFGLVEFSIGITGFLLILLFSRLPDASSWIASFYSENSRNTTWGGNVCLEFILSFIVMIVPGILIGLTFPLATQITTSNLKSVGRSIGNIYSINTAGGIFGAMITGCLMVPLIGLKFNQVYIAGLNVLTGLVLLSIPDRSKITDTLKRPVSKIILVPPLCFLAIGIGIFCSLYDIRIWDKTSTLLYYKEGSAATVSVVRSNDGNRSLNVNSRYTLGTSKATPLQQRMGYIPLLLHDKPQEVLVIGMGTGITLGAVSSYELTETVNCIEIIPHVVEAAKQFFANENHMINNEKTNIIVEDGRNYILINKKKYDVIISDLFVPYHAGAGSLYTKEHFEVCRERLLTNGLFCQWMPLYQMSGNEFKTICKTFCDTFPFATLWFCNFERGLICGLVGTNEKLTINPSDLENRMNLPGLKTRLKNAILGSAEELLSLYVTDKEGLELFARGFAINSNNEPVIEFLAPKNIYKFGWKAGDKNVHPGIQNLSSTAKIRKKVLSITSLKSNRSAIPGETDNNISFDVKNLEYYSQATGYFISGMLHFNNNMLLEAEDDFLTAWELAPGYLYIRKIFQDLSVELYRAGNYDETIFINEKLKNANTDIIDPYLYFYLGLAYQAESSNEKAISAYHQALAMNPLNKASIHHNLGLIYQNLGLPDKADHEFAEAKRYAR